MLNSLEETIGHLRRARASDIELETTNLLYSIVLGSIFLTALIGTIPGAGVPMVIASASVAMMFLATTCVSYVVSIVSNSIPLGILSSIAMICLVGIDRTYFSTVCFSVLCTISVVYVLLNLRISKNNTMAFLISTIAISIFVTGLFQYTSFDMMALAHLGTIHNDTIFHASIAAMIKNYGSVSTGLNGLVETPYHVLSHTVVAGFSRLSGESTLQIYGFINKLFFMPLFILSILFSALNINSNGRYHADNLVLISILLNIFLCIFLYKWAFWDSYTLSESYILSLIIIIIGVPSLAKRDISPFDALICLLVAYGTAQAKGSVGLVYVAAWSARLILTGGWKRKSELTIFFLVILAFLLGAGRAAQANSSAEFEFLDFIRRYSLYGQSIHEVIQAWKGEGKLSPGIVAYALFAMASFVLFHFFLVWVVILHKACTDGLTATLRSPMVACCLGAMAFGLLISSVYNLPGAAVYYFSSVANFIALPAVVAITYDGLRWSYQRTFGSDAYARGIVTISCLTLITMSGTRGYEQLIDRPSSSGLARNEFVSGLLELRTDSPLGIVFRASPTVLSMNPQKLCWTRPFSYPALSERAWTGVIEKDPDCAYLYYGYGYYGVDTEEQSIKVALTLGNSLLLEDWLGPGRHQ